MGDIIEHVEDTDLEPLQRAAHLCAAAGLAGFEVVVRALHAACVAAAAAGRELAVVAFEAAQNVPWAEMSAACASALGDAAAAATEAAKTGGALLLVAMKESGEFSEEAAAAAAEMAKTGALATGAAATEIAQKMAPILAKLSDAACEVIQRSFALACHAGGEGAKLLWAALVPAVREAIAFGREYGPYLLYALVPLALPALAAYFAYQGAKWLAQQAYGVLKDLPYEEMAKVAGEIATAAGKATAAAAGAAGEALVDAGAAAGAALAPVARAAGEAVAEGAEVALDAAAIAATAVGDAAEDFWESGIIQNAMGDAVDAGEELFSSSREELLKLYSVVSGIGIAGCFSWLDANQLNILLDYMQLLGLYISQLAGGAWTFLAPFFGSIFNFFAIDFGAIIKGLAIFIGEEVVNNIDVIAIVASVIVLVVAIVVSLVCLTIFCCIACKNRRGEADAQEARGHEKHQTWEELAGESKAGARKVKFMKVLSGVFLALIVPVGRLSLSAAACQSQIARIYRYIDPTVTPFTACVNSTDQLYFGDEVGWQCDCTAFSFHLFVMIFALVVSGIYVFAVPCFLMVLIKVRFRVSSVARLRRCTVSVRACTCASVCLFAPRGASRRDARILFVCLCLP